MYRVAAGTPGGKTTRSPTPQIQDVFLTSGQNAIQHWISQSTGLAVATTAEFTGELPAHVVIPLVRQYEYGLEPGGIIPGLPGKHRVGGVGDCDAGRVTGWVSR